MCNVCYSIVVINIQWYLYLQRSLSTKDIFGKILRSFTKKFQVMKAGKGRGIQHFLILFPIIASVGSFIQSESLSLSLMLVDFK